MKVWQRVRPHFSWANISVAFFALVGLIGAVPYENQVAGKKISFRSGMEAVGNTSPARVAPFFPGSFRSRHKQTEEGKQVFNYYGSITSQGGNITIMRQPKKEVLQSDHSSL